MFVRGHTTVCISQRCLFAIFLFFSAAVVRADEKKPVISVGQRAPDLKLVKLLQAPQESFPGLDSLKDQVVCIEFWATWCGPCRKAIPHINELAEKLANKPVKFISVSGEDESVVRKFCEKNSMRGWIGLDSNRSTSQSYGVERIPLTVLIDRAGKVAGITSPEQVTEKDILDVLDGKPIRFKSPRMIYRDEFLQYLRNDEEAKSESLFVFTIQPSRVVGKTVAGQASGFPGSYDARAMNLRLVLSAAYDVRWNRVLGSLPILDQAFDVRFHASLVSRAQAAKIMQESLCTTLYLSIRSEIREVDAYVLTLPGTPGEDLKRSEGLGSFSPGGKTIRSRNYPISQLANTLEACLKEPVLDETGLKGGFDYELAFNRDKPQDIFVEMEKRLGLKVIRAKRPVEFLMVKDSE